MDYRTFREKQQAEWNAFPIGFAFNDEQFREQMAKLGVKSEKELIGIGQGGGFIRRTDKQAYIDLVKRSDRELKEYLSDDDQLRDAIEYEMFNHEYIYNWEGDEDVLNALGYDESDYETDDRLRRTFGEAKRNYYRYCEEHDIG